MDYNLFLDDERLPGHVTWVELPSTTWQVVRDFDEFVMTVQEYGLPVYVTFDHDLADQMYGHGLNGDAIPYETYTEKTGYDCAKWLVQYCIDNNLKFPEYQVHSMNPIGKENIIQYINSAKRSAGI